MKRFLSLLLTFVLLVCMVPVNVLAVQAQTTPMYRLYNPNSGEHFYTGSTQEKDNLVSVGWNYEGIAWNAPIKGGDPVYRLYNPKSGDHHYTMSKEESDMLVGVGWQYEGVCWNSVAAGAPGAVPLFRLYNPNADCGSHHYTNSTEERDNLVAVGWILEGIGWFGAVTAAEPPVGVSLSIDKDYIEMDTGDTETITATYSGYTGSPSWSSSDPSVAIVSDGKVTAVGEGVAIISAAYGGKIAQCVISASQKVEETEPEIGPAAYVWKSSNNGSWDIGCVGNQLSFHSAGRTEEGEDGKNMQVTAFSSDTGIATVSVKSNGDTSIVTVSFIKTGSVTITLTSVDGNASTSFTIQVKSYSAQYASTPEAFAAACNYVIEMNDCSVNANGNYTVLTLSDVELTWSKAITVGQSTARRAWSVGNALAAITYEGVNEEGFHVFYCHAV